eukprot:TRINITY_DN34000_c0_g1_i2.p1 TRINITY_DN34000_c0_g1~~TRINITY_DN34000_c0_g1_i2.p1  ORF type:complete len:430 (+),score=161.57 TRINITY_DN34000_c0_g1_i2:59-1291(+)
MPSVGDVGCLAVVGFVLLPVVCSLLPWWEFTGETTLGIDLGTTYSVGSVCMSGSAHAVTVDRNTSLVPSMVAFHDGVWVGVEAEDMVVDYPEEVVYVAKRFIGRKFDDPSVQAELPEVPFKVQAGKDGFAEFRIGARTVTPEEVGASILRRVKDRAEKDTGFWKSLLGFKFFTATVSVPVSFDGMQRAATHRAGKLAGFSMIRLIEEPVAAATAFNAVNVRKYTDIIVYDMGGGTLDVALLRLQPDTNTFSIISTSGDAKLGGSDFDRCLVSFVVRKGAGVAPGDDAALLHDMDPHVRAQLVKTVEAAKRRLSSQKEAPFSTPWGEMSLTNGDLENACKSLIDRAMAPVNDVMETFFANEDDLQVVLAGGSSRLGPIRDLLKARFGADHVHSELNADLAISLGASQAYSC